MEPFSTPSLADVPNQQSLELLISTVTEFLQSEIRNSTIFLIHCQSVSEQDEFSRVIELQNESLRDRTLVRETQRFVDKCECWLMSHKEHVPFDDPVFQKVAWLCGVAHDVLPDAIREAKAGVEQFEEDERWNEKAHRRLKYVETLYLIIHDYVTSLISKTR